MWSVISAADSIWACICCWGNTEGDDEVSKERWGGEQNLERIRHGGWFFSVKCVYVHVCMLGQICVRVWNCTFAYEAFPDARVAPVRQFQSTGQKCCILWTSVGSHHWSVTWNGRAAFNLDRGLPKCLYLCVSTYSRLRILQIQKASASFRRWFLCTTSSVNQIQHGGAFTRLHLLLPISAWCECCFCSQLPIIHMHAHIKTEVTDIVSWRRSTGKHISKKWARGVFTTEYNHCYRQTNGKYTGKESTQEAVCWSCRGWRMQNNRKTLGTQASHLSKTWTDWAHSDMTDVDWLIQEPSHPGGRLAPFLFLTWIYACT